MAALGAGDIDRRAADHQARRLVLPAGPELRSVAVGHRVQRAARSIVQRRRDGMVGLDEAIRAARGRSPLQGAVGLSGDVDHSVGAKGHRIGLNRGAARAEGLLGPEFLARGVEHRDEAAVGRSAGRRLGDAVAGIQVAGGRADDGHLAAVRRHRQGQARRAAGGPEGAGIDHVAGRIVLDQGDVLSALDRLPPGRGGHVGQGIDGPVGRGRDRMDGAGAGVEGFAEHLSGGGRCGQRRRPGVELDQLLGGVRRLASGDPRGLGDIDGGLCGGRREGQVLDRNPFDLKGVLVGILRQGDGLAADLRGVGRPRRHHAGEPGGEAGVLELAVQIRDHRAHGARRRSHLGQVEIDRRLRAGNLGGGDGELHVALECRNRSAGRAAVDRPGGVGVGFLGRQTGRFRRRYSVALQDLET